MKVVSVVFLVLLASCDVKGGGTSDCRARKTTGLNFRIRKDNVIDLTHVTNDKAAHWPGFPSGLKVTELFKGLLGGKVYAYYNKLDQPEHLGTHMDAPNHFAPDGLSIDEVSLDTLIAIGVLLDLTTDGKRFNETLVTVEHFLEWERKNGQIRSGSIILIRTGFGEEYYDRSIYYGTSVEGEDSIPHLQFPGLSEAAARFLVNDRCVAAVGIDAMSIDEGQSKYFLAHQVLSYADVPIFENVANLDKLAAKKKRFKVIALPYNVEKASGTPVRIIAVTN